MSGTVQSTPKVGATIIPILQMQKLRLRGRIQPQDVRLQRLCTRPTRYLASVQQAWSCGGQPAPRQQPAGEWPGLEEGKVKALRQSTWSQPCPVWSAPGLFS